MCLNLTTRTISPQHPFRILQPSLICFSMHREEYVTIGEDEKRPSIHGEEQPWSARNNLHIILQSSISKSTMPAFFGACLESIFLCGVETWPMKKEAQDRLDGIYTRRLMRELHGASTRSKNSFTEIFHLISALVPRCSVNLGAEDHVITDAMCWRLP